MIDWIRDRLKKAPNNLEDLSIDDLQREQIRLQQQEKKLVQEIDDLEGQKKTLFNEGKSAAGSVHRQRSIAQRIVGVDQKVKMTDRKLRTISKQLQLVGNLVYLKQNKAELEQSGIWGTISDMDLGDLEAYITKASVDGQFNADKLSAMLAQVTGSMDLATGIDDDPEVAAIMEMFQSEGEDSDLSNEYDAEGIALDDPLSDL